MCNFIHGHLVFLCMYVFLSVCPSVHSFFRQILTTFSKHARGSVGTLKQFQNSPRWGIVGGTNVVVLINYVTQNNSYVQLLATLCIIVI